jgi:hypothetical protein
MQQFFTAIRQAVHKNVLILSLISLLSLSSLFIFVQPSALAASNKPLNPPSQAEEVIDRAYTLSEATGLREEDRQATQQTQQKQRQSAYEEATQAINDPKGLDKIYEEDLKVYKEETQPDQGLVEGAKDLIKNITGND